MKLLLSGAHIENKGDELMLYAVRNRLRARLPEAELVRQWGSSSYEYAAKMGYLRLVPRPSPSKLHRLLPLAVLSRYRRSLGLVLESELDAVLNFAGLSYTDEWGPKNVEKAAAQFERMHKSGAKIIMLPQSLGPFTHPRTKAGITRMVDRCALVYARDQLSLEMLQKVVGQRPNLHCAPDLTHGIEGEIPDDFDASIPRGIIVPNFWLVNKENRDNPEKYFRFLAAAVKQFVAHGLEPLVVLHAPFQDRDLLAGLEKECGRKLPVANYENPVHLKGILGTAKIAIGSRFHALIGLLSQSVPAIAVGWSHKFNMLFQEYGVEHCLMSADVSEAELTAKIRSLVAGDERRSVVSALGAAANQQKQLVEEMWSNVETVLGIPRPLEPRAANTSGAADPVGDYVHA